MTSCCEINSANIRTRRSAIPGVTIAGSASSSQQRSQGELASFNYGCGLRITVCTANRFVFFLETSYCCPGVRSESRQGGVERWQNKCTRPCRSDSRARRSPLRYDAKCFGGDNMKIEVGSAQSLRYSKPFESNNRFSIGANRIGRFYARSRSGERALCTYSIVLKVRPLRSSMVCLSFSNRGGSWPVRPAVAHPWCDRRRFARALSADTYPAQAAPSVARRDRTSRRISERRERPMNASIQCGLYVKLGRTLSRALFPRFGFCPNSGHNVANFSLATTGPLQASQRRAAEADRMGTASSTLSLTRLTLPACDRPQAPPLSQDLSPAEAEKKAHRHFR